MTSLLYPRLTPLAARTRLAEHSGKSIDALRKTAEHRHPDMYYAATGGEPASSEHLTALADAIRVAAGRHGYPRSATDSARTGADRTLAAALFRLMHLNPAEAAVKDSWTFLSVQLVPDVVAWRWEATTSTERWLCLDITRHSLGRLWWHAYTLGIPSADGGVDLTLLERLTESDLNQIFERRSIGGRPPLARAIARSVTDAELVPADIARRRVIRDVTSRVRRLLPFTMFLAVDDTRLQARIDQLVRDAVQALTPVSSTPR
jgi:hypothetical protein